MANKNANKTPPSASVKKYTVRPGVINFGKEYECKVAALFSLRCVLRNLETMWLASNADGAGNFDDVILHIKEEGHEEMTFMLQLKHKETPVNIAQREFTSLKGDFALAKYFKDIERLHKAILSDGTKDEIVSDLGRFENIYFVLFTNRGISDLDFLEKVAMGDLAFLNTGADMYKFNLTKLPEAAAYSKVSANLYLLCDQIDAQQIDKQIVEELANIANSLQLVKVNVEEIAKAYTAYVTSWAKGLLGGHFYLKKEHVLYKVTELLLNQYCINLAETALLNSSDNSLIWNQIMSHQTVTLVNCTETTLDFVTRFLSTEVQNYCKHKIKTWDAQLSRKQLKSFYKTPALKEHIVRNIGDHRNVYTSDIYKSLWGTKTLPLLLRITNSEQSRNIDNVLKLTDHAYPVIILHENDANPLDGKHFKTLADLDEENRKDILEYEVRLQGRPGAQLKKLIRKDMLRHISTADIIEILSNNFSIGQSIQAPPEYFVERTIIKRVINREVLHKHKEEIFLIDGGAQVFNLIEDVDLDHPEDIPGVMTIAGPLTPHQLVKLKATKKAIHILQDYNENYFQLKWSYELTKNVTDCMVELQCPLHQGHVDLFIRTTSIIEAAPGMGKTTIMDYVASQAPTDYWVLKVVLNKHQSYFRHHNCRTSNTEARLHLWHFYDRSDSELCSSIFETFVASKKVVVLLDGFDEVAISFEKEVTNIARSLRQDGYFVCITTRPLMKQYLEETLRTLSDTIKPFTIDDQENCLMNTFQNELNLPSQRETVKNFAKSLLEATRSSLNDTDADFTGIPLQTKLLADAFSGECKHCVLNGGVIDFRENFDLLFLYEKFIDKKVKVFLNKHGESVYGLYEEIKDYQYLFALKIVFPKEFSADADIMGQLANFYASARNKKQLEQLGIIWVDDSLNVSCIHRTIAEYLSAQWMIENSVNSENVQMKRLACTLIKARFSENYKFLFYIFDKIACQDCALHTAILTGQADQALIVVEETKTDRTGRSALHLVALNSLRYQLPGTPSHISFCDEPLNAVISTILSSSMELSATDAIGYTPLDYALANCSLATANKIQEKANATIINAYINLDFKTDYLKYCLKYPKLFKLLLPYFLSRDAILNNIAKRATVNAYVTKLIQSNELLLDEDMTVSKFLGNYMKCTDLRYAVIFSTHIEELLNHGADINSQDMDDTTLLHYAVLHNKPKIVKLLLERGAKIKQNVDGNTALHLAISQMNFKIVKRLIANRVDVNITNRVGHAALHMVAANTNRSFLDTLKKTEILKLILKNGGKINEANREGDMPLHVAIASGNERVAKLLIAADADVNAGNEDGITPLHLAALKGYKHIAQLLTAKGAHVNSTNNNGDMPLYLALDRGYPNTVELLITKGGEFNEKGSNGNVPLHSALIHGYKNVVKLIVAKGDVDVPNNNGNTPLHLAILGGHKYLVKARVDVNEADSKTKDPPSPARCYREFVKLIIAKGANVNVKNKDGETPLHIAARRKTYKDMVELLISNGAEINAENIIANTPLHIASRRGYKDIVRLIISKGGCVTAKNYSNNTPLHLALLKGHPDVAKLIIAKGGHVNENNKNDETPTEIARRQGYGKIVQLLSDMGE